MPSAARFRKHRTCWLLSVALLVPAIVGASTVPVRGHADPPDSLNQAPKPPATIWAACPNSEREEAELKLVRKFDRGPGAAAGGATMPGGTSELLCGHERYGYYHIVERHFVEWNQKSILTSENWREVADYSIAEALRNPMAVAFRAGTNTFCYSREIALVNKLRGIIVDVMHPNVVVRVQDGAVITAFPSRTACVR